MKQSSSFIAVSIITSYDLDSLSDSDSELSIAEKCTGEAAGNRTLGSQRAQLRASVLRDKTLDWYSLSLHWWSMSGGTHGVIARPRGPVALLLAWDTIPRLCLQSGVSVNRRNLHIAIASYCYTLISYLILSLVWVLLAGVHVRIHPHISCRKRRD